MILPIYVYGHPVLRKVSEDITMDYPNLEKLISDMFISMDESDGVGLAAPQIGKNIRLFVVEGTPFADLDPSIAGFRKAFINAHIIERSNTEVTRGEGCLSIPGIHEEVSRPDKIKMRYLDANGESHEEEFTGIRAWIIQHEYDHLDGILFTDHISPLRKRILKSKLAKITTGKVNVHYRIVLPRK